MHPSLKIHLDEKRTLKTAPEGRIQAKNVMIRPIFKKPPRWADVPVPQGKPTASQMGQRPPQPSSLIPEDSDARPAHLCHVWVTPNHRQPSPRSVCMTRRLAGI